MNLACRLFPVHISSGLNYRYAYDDKGLMTSRSESVINRKETFTYDKLDRLTKITPNYGATQALSYSLCGNIKTYGTGIYTYGSPKPHAVTLIDNNPTPFNSSTVTYNFFNQPVKIKEGNNEINLSYGSNQQRNETFEYENAQLKSHRIIINKYCEREMITFRSPAFPQFYHYIYGDNGVVAVRINDVLGRDSLYYIHTDHLGSYCAITNANKQVRQRNYFDPWGNYQRVMGNPKGIPPGDPQLEETPGINFTLTNRGFTGHEHYPYFKIINMNGRLYDPVIGRFFSPDKRDVTIE